MYFCKSWRIGETRAFSHQISIWCRRERASKRGWHEKTSRHHRDSNHRRCGELVLFLNALDSSPLLLRLDFCRRSAIERELLRGLDDWRRSERNRAFIISWIYIPGAVHDKVGLFSRYVFGASAGLLFSTPVLSACSSSVFGTRSFKQVVFLTCGVGRSFSLSLFLWWNDVSEQLDVGDFRRNFLNSGFDFMHQWRERVFWHDHSEVEAAY